MHYISLFTIKSPGRAGKVTRRGYRRAIHLHHLRMGSLRCMNPDKNSLYASVFPSGASGAWEIRECCAYDGREIKSGVLRLGWTKVGGRCGHGPWEFCDAGVGVGMGSEVISG
jgi:hypothetical protein